MVQRLPDSRWQLQNSATGEWCTFTEDDLLDRFARSEMSFIAAAEACGTTGGLAAKLTRDLAACPPELVALGRKRDRAQVDRCFVFAVRRRDTFQIFGILLTPGWPGFFGSPHDSEKPPDR